MTSTWRDVVSDESLVHFTGGGPLNGKMLRVYGPMPPHGFRFRVIVPPGEGTIELRDGKTIDIENRFRVGWYELALKSTEFWLTRVAIWKGVEN